jgi:hypothetical protein
MRAPEHQNVVNDGGVSGPSSESKLHERLASKIYHGSLLSIAAGVPQGASRGNFLCPIIGRVTEAPLEPLSLKEDEFVRT